MAKRFGGTPVKTGFYWNLRKWEMATIPKQGGVLPGGIDDAFLKVPVIGLLVLAPLMGAAYAIFLPFIGFAMLFTFFGKKAMAATRSGAVDVAATMGPSWRPGEAYLAGTNKDRDAREAADETSPEEAKERRNDHE